MNITSTQFTLNTNSLEIYISGCNQQCSQECHNKDLWNFNYGTLYNNEYFQKIKNKVSKFDTLIKSISIFGGEPMDQNKDELILFLYDISSLNKEVWLYTSYEFDDVCDEIKQYLDYIKCGKFDKDLLVVDNIQFGIKLSTSNQNIYKL